MNIAVRYFTRSGNTEKLAKEEFHCHGRFKNVHVGKPDEDDLKRVAEFATSVVK